MDYKQKYLKYRQKYLKLKNQLGGAKCQICGGDHDTHDCPTTGEANGVAGPAVATGATGPEDEDNDGWTTVTKKPKKIRVERPPPPNISLEELKGILFSVIYRSNLYSLVIAGYIYGSRARRKNRPDSDADIIIFWTRNPGYEFLEELRTEIETALGFEIDLISCIYQKGREVKNVSITDNAYYDSVIADVKIYKTQFIGESYDVEYLISSSVKLSKLERR